MTHRVPRREISQRDLADSGRVNSHSTFELQKGRRTKSFNFSSKAKRRVTSPLKISQNLKPPLVARLARLSA